MTCLAPARNAHSHTTPDHPNIGSLAIRRQRFALAGSWRARRWREYRERERQGDRETRRHGEAGGFQVPLEFRFSAPEGRTSTRRFWVFASPLMEFAAPCRSPRTFPPDRLG